MARRLERRARAAPAQVWALLGDGARWPEFDPLVHRVGGPDGPLRQGDRRVLVTRPVRAPFTLDVGEVLPEQYLHLRVQMAPGLAVDSTWELTPALRGGTVVTLTESPVGLFAVPSWAALQAVASVRLRRLASRAAADTRAAGRRGRGAA